MQQAEALSILKTGANVFLTGEPGSGKTHTVNQYVAHLRSCGIEPAITASTGIAATHIGGLTIHSWSGIGVRSSLSKYDLDRIGQNRNVVRRIENTRVLIIDEVSMLSGNTLDMIDAVCREVRRNNEPFGGLQVVLVGDFFQLPPIISRNNEGSEEVLMDDEYASRTGFAFESRAWSALSPIVCYLSEQHRQEDEEFLSFLSAIRAGATDESHIELLRTRYSRTPKGEVAQLYTHNANVDGINTAALRKLAGEESVFEMEARGPEKLIAALKRGCLSPEVLSLKPGARVMFTKNDLRQQYVNGTLGVVKGFSKENGFPLVETHAGKVICAELDEWRIEDGGKVLARISQVPLRLAWAITVHKSQGMSLDAAHMDLSQTFEYGQGYVALSRVRTLQGLTIAGLNKRALEVHPTTQEQDERFRETSDEAQAAFAKIAKKELDAMHANFVRACGGKIGAGRKKAEPKRSTYEVTKEMILQKCPIEAIANDRGITVSTVFNHLEKLVKEKELDPTQDLSYLKPNALRFEKMLNALEKVNKKEKRMLLTPAREMLGDEYSYEEIRLSRLFVDKC